MNRMPLLIPALAMLAGVVGWEVGMSWWLPVGCLLAGAVLFALRRGSVGVALWLCGLGWCLAMLKSPSEMPHDYDGGAMAFCGRVTAMGEGSGGRLLDVEIDSLDGREVAPFKAAITLAGIDPFVDAGQQIRGKAIFELLDTVADLPGAINYDRLLAGRGIRAKAFLSADSLTAMGYAPTLVGQAMRLRRGVIDALCRLDVSTPCVAFLTATIAADRSLMSPDTRQAFAASGLAHLLAISGLHVGLLMWTLLLLLGPLTGRIGRTPVMLIVLVSVWAYAFVAGLPPSVVRAAVMVSLMLLASILSRRNNSFNALAAALILFLWFDPSAVASVSFQLSFVATLSILLFARRLNPFNSKTQPQLSQLCAPLAASVAATLGTAVWVISSFHTLPLLFLPANAVASVVAVPLVGGGFLLATLSAIGIHLHPLCAVTEWLYSLLDHTAHSLSSVDWAVADGLYLPPETIALALLTVAALAWAANMRRPLPVVALAGLAASATLMSATMAPEPRAAEAVVAGKRMGPFANILVTTPDTLFILSTASPGYRIDLESRLQTRYAPFMSHYGVGALKLLKASRLPVILTGDTARIIFTGQRRVPAVEAKLRILYLCAPFKGDAAEAVRRCRADSVVIVEGFDRRVGNRHCHTLDTASVSHTHFKKRATSGAKGRKFS